MISEEEIRNIAKLSYLNVKDEEIDKLREKFSTILDYVKKLQEIDISDTAETANLSQINNVFREDKGEQVNTEDIIKAFSKRKDNFLEVKKILYNED